MSDRKQSAVSRRLLKKQGYITGVQDGITNNQIFNRLTASEQKIFTLETKSTNTETLSVDTNARFNTQLDISIPGTLNYRLTEVEARPYGGFDPSNPNSPIVIVDNFIQQSNGDESGSGTPYTPLPLPAVTPTNSSTLTPTDLEIYEANSETDHLGVVLVRKPAVNGTPGYLQLVNSPTIDSFTFTDFNVVYFILKTPVSGGDPYGFLVGLVDDFTAFQNGIFFSGSSTTGLWTPTTVSSGVSTTGTTTALAADTWYTLKIEKKSSSEVGFTINNGTEQVLTTNIPTSFLTAGLIFTTTTYNQDMDFKLDFFSLKLKASNYLSQDTIVQGTTNEVEVTTLDSVITVGLPDSITVANTITTDQLEFNTAPSTNQGIAKLQWDNDYKTLRLGMDANINAPLSQSLYKRVRNSSNTTSINLGEVVYINGSQGATVLQVGLADASTEATAATTIGLAAETIPHTGGGTGMVILQGLLTGLNTNAYAAGDLVWLSTTPGAWTTTRPQAPNHGVFLGWVVKSAGAPDGSIYVKVGNGQELAELHDVYIPSTPTNGDVLQWDNIDSRWENKSLATAGISTVGHTHSLSDITINENSVVILVDDFLSQSNETGELGIAGWNFTNGSIQASNAEVDHPGIVIRRSGTTANQVASIYLGLATSTGIFRWDQFDSVTFIFDAVATNTDHIVRIGLFTDLASSTAVTSACIERANGNAYFTPRVSRSSNVESTATQFTYDTNWHKIKIRRISANQIGFTYDSASEVVITDSSINAFPQASDTFNIGLQIIPTTTTARDIKLDYVQLKLLAPTR